MHRPSFVNSFIAWEIGELIPVSSYLHPFFGCSCRCIGLQSSTLSLLGKLENSFPFHHTCTRFSVAVVDASAFIRQLFHCLGNWRTHSHFIIPAPVFGCSCSCISLHSSTLSLLGKLENSFPFHHACTRFSVAVVDASAFHRQLFHCLGNWRTHSHFIMPAPVFQLQL